MLSINFNFPPFGFKYEIVVNSSPAPRVGIGSRIKRQDFQGLSCRLKKLTIFELQTQDTYHTPVYAHVNSTELE